MVLRLDDDVEDDFDDDDDFEDDDDADADADDEDEGDDDEPETWQVMSASGPQRPHMVREDGSR